MTQKTNLLHTTKTKEALQNFVSSLNEAKTTTQPFIIALTGLVGSGKSTVARTLASKLKATIIRGDTARVHLRNAGENYSYAEKLVFAAIEKQIKQQRAVIVDSDVINLEKRKKLSHLARTYHLPLFYIRIVCDIDTAIKRIIKADYTTNDDILFKNPETKIRELWRRTPLHYRWDKTPATQQWKLAPLSFRPFAIVDTTTPKTLKKQITELAKHLKTKIHKKTQQKTP